MNTTQNLTIQQKTSNSQRSSVTPFICKVKSNTWKEYQSIGKIPQTFYQMVEILSIKFYPRNFSIAVVTDDDIIMIGDEVTYDNVVREVISAGNAELKIFVYLYDIGEAQAAISMDADSDDVSDEEENFYSEENAIMCDSSLCCDRKNLCRLSI